MNFVKFVSLKYKITNNNPNKSKLQLYAGWFAGIVLYALFVCIIFMIIKLLPSTVQSNMDKYTISLFAFLCIISISTAMKNFYHEYFSSPEREILLFVPIERSQIILSRFFVITDSIVLVNFLVLFSFVLANVLAGNLDLPILLITVPQIITYSIFSSSLAHLVYSFAFFISRGKQLKKVAYLIMTGASVGVIIIIIYIQNYADFFLSNNSYFAKAFYVIFQYPFYLLSDQFYYSQIFSFTITVCLNALLFFIISYYITKLAYHKGLLAITARDTEGYANPLKISKKINHSLRNQFLIKDLLYLIRNPKLFSNFMSPILFISLIEYKNQFASWGVFLTILINIIAIVFLVILINLVFSDDLNNQELLFVVPFNIVALFKSRSKMLNFLCFLISSIFILVICILESLRIEFILFAIIQLFIITYIHSKVLVARVIKRNIGSRPGYWYSGKIVKDTFIYFFQWNIPLLFLFCFLQEYFRRFIEKHPFSLQAYIVFCLTLLIILIMIIRSKKVSKKIMEGVYHG
ncbi:elicitor-associated permease-like protein [Caldifermentibacillus hisashii]|uniref:Elicitor-associated permease-like protein n=1 Tax=Caldifermentibacillus hisashii TaxID=996558 RepID=A0ABU9K268_9BACI